MNKFALHILEVLNQAAIIPLGNSPEPSDGPDGIYLVVGVDCSRKATSKASREQSGKGVEEGL